MPRCAGADLPTPALFRIDDDRQLESPENGQCRVIGGKVEPFDVVTLRVLGPDRFEAGFRDRAPHLAVERKQPLHPGRVHGPDGVSTARTVVGGLTAEAIHRRALEMSPRRPLCLG